MIDVTAGILIKNNRVFCARRGPGKHLAGHWEFPGGKLNPGETPEACLVRELEEELAIKVRVTDFICESIYDYGDKIVRLLAYRVKRLVPKGLYQGDAIQEDKIVLSDHDAMDWVPVRGLRSLNWAPADLAVVDALNGETEGL